MREVQEFVVKLGQLVLGRRFTEQQGKDELNLFANWDKHLVPSQPDNWVCTDVWQWDTMFSVLADGIQGVDKEAVYMSSSTQLLFLSRVNQGLMRHKGLDDSDLEL